MEGSYGSTNLAFDPVQLLCQPLQWWNHNCKSDGTSHRKPVALNYRDDLRLGIATVPM